MIINEDHASSRYQIKAYSPGAITINETTYEKSLILSASTLITDWPPHSLSDLTPAHLDTLLTLNPQIILLGTGKQFALPETSLLAPLYEKQFSVECMDTGAACRTFMALAAEDRNVVAALLID